MRRLLQGCVVLAVVIAAFLLGRWSGGARPEAVPTTVTGATERVAAGHDAAETLRPARTPSQNLPPSAPPTPARAASATSAPDATRLPDVAVSPSATGPTPLTAEDETALVRAERMMRADGGTVRDLLDLAKDEQPDEQAAQLEALIGQSILRHGGRYTALRVSPPRCTRSVCIMRAVGLAVLQDPRSDWQSLSLAVANEPWFREAFDDMSGTVVNDGPNAVYITLYVRCEPGTCRIGRR